MLHIIYMFYTIHVDMFYEIYDSLFECESMKLPSVLLTHYIS